MIRPARTTDVFDLVAILVDQHPRSRYAGTTQVDQPYTRRLLAQAIQRSGGTHDGSTLVMVVERDGKVLGFVLGVLDRQHHIMDSLRAQDMFLVVSDGAPKLAVRSLIQAYVAWAEGIPAVHEIVLSHTDALPEGERISSLYLRMGFEPCGAIYRRDLARSAAGSEAA